MEIYKNHKIPIIRFFYAFNENDYRALVKDFDVEEVDDDFKYDGDEDLEEVFYDIYYKYCELIKDEKTLSMLNKKKYILDKQTEYSIVSNILNVFKETEDLRVLYILNSLDNYSIDMSKNLNPQISSIIRKLKLLKNRINLKTIQFDKRYKNKLEKNTKSKIDVYLQCSELELALDLKYPLDPYETTLVKWCSMINLAKAKSKRYEQNKNNSNRSFRSNKKVSTRI